MPSIIKGIPYIFAAKTISKYVTDYFISKKINNAFEKAKTEIAAFYKDFLRNAWVFIILNVITLILTLIPYLFFSINDIIIVLISILSIFMIIRFIFLSIKNIIKIRPYLKDISIFLSSLRDNKSLSKTIKEYIRYRFQKMYFDNTNTAGRFTHSLLSNMDFVKSKDDIEDAVVNSFYRLTAGFLIRNIIYRVMAFVLFYSIFIFILKPIIFSFAMEMNVFQVLFYPFTIGIPNIIMVIRGS